MISPYDITIRYHHTISPYDITIWYHHMISPYDITIWYLHMISSYDISIWYLRMILVAATNVNYVFFTFVNRCQIYVCRLRLSYVCCVSPYVCLDFRNELSRIGYAIYFLTFALRLWAQCVFEPYVCCTFVSYVCFTFSTFVNFGHPPTHKRKTNVIYVCASD